MSNNIRFNSVYFLLELAINIIRLVLSRNMSMSMHSAQKKKKVHVNATKRDHCVRFCQFILCLPLRTKATSLISISLSPFKAHLESVWYRLFLPTYFTIQFIFAIIYGSHYIFWYYSSVPLYYFN